MLPLYFYPRSPCGERQYNRQVAQSYAQISIHALLAESDPLCNVVVIDQCHFYPRSPCGERRSKNNIKERIKIFLSTLSLRRATQSHWYPSLFQNNFYPRSPCGERLGILASPVYRNAISIHALLAESDVCRLWNTPTTVPISIHALLAESDCCFCDVIFRIICDFYPRSPCGERPGFTFCAQGAGSISIHALLAESDHASM